jgi:YD repeat-containing protein
MGRVIGRVAAAIALCGLIGAGPGWAASGTRTSSFAYDSATGLLTQEVVEPNTSSLRLETDYVYDAFGNKTSVTVSGVDIVTRTSTTTYDSLGQFATTNTNALSQSESWIHDPRFGTPTSHTGPNGLITTWSYDVYGRKTQEVRPDGPDQVDLPVLQRPWRQRKLRRRSRLRHHGDALRLRRRHPERSARHRLFRHARPRDRPRQPGLRRQHHPGVQAVLRPAASGRRRMCEGVISSGWGLEVSRDEPTPGRNCSRRFVSSHCRSWGCRALRGWSERRKGREL